LTPHLRSTCERPLSTSSGCVWVWPPTQRSIAPGCATEITLERLRFRLVAEEVEIGSAFRRAVRAVIFAGPERPVGIAAHALVVAGADRGPTAPALRYPSPDYDLTKTGRSVRAAVSVQTHCRGYADSLAGSCVRHIREDRRKPGRRSCGSWVCCLQIERRKGDKQTGLG
jgi:hypothetical protein